MHAHKRHGLPDLRGHVALGAGLARHKAHASLYLVNGLGEPKIDELDVRQIACEEEVVGFDCQARV